jgi:uncharacterized phage-associated protein
MDGKQIEMVLLVLMKATIPSKKITIVFDDTGNLPASDVRAFSHRYRNQPWIGTIKGFSIA